MTPSRHEGKTTQKITGPITVRQTALHLKDLLQLQPLDLNSCAYKNFEYCSISLKSDSSQAYIFKPQMRLSHLKKYLSGKKGNFFPDAVFSIGFWIGS